MGNPAGITLQSEKYQVIRELGRGGMGVVYLAEDRQLNRHVALKVLYEHLNRDSAFVERFREEARSVSTLHHPHIVCVHGLERSGETVAIDMEYVPGQSLDRYRQVSQLNAHVVAGIAADVLSGLATCHEIGVVHRDIKPSNILIGEDGRAKITDFGLATAYALHLEATVRGNTSSGFYMGTPRYMPIQAWEGSRAEPFWDLYAFGVVLFELLSGRTAFDGDNPVAIMRQQLTQPLPRLQDISGQVSPELSALVEQLLATGSNANAGTGTRDALAALLETPEYRELNESNKSITLALPPPRRKAHALPPGTYPRWLLALAVPVLLLALLVGYFALRGAGPPPPAADGAEPFAQAPADPTAAMPSVPSLPPSAAQDSEVFLDVMSVNQNDMGDALWMMETDGRGYPDRIVGVGSLELWWIAVSPADPGDRQQLNGFWGATLASGNLTSHHGTLEGSLLWEPALGRMAVHVVRARTRDNTSTELSLSGLIKPAPFDRTRFLRTLEQNETLQCLLYRELLARQLPWAVEIESMLPALPDARAAAPHVAATVTIDGVLDEPLWTETQYNASGRSGELTARAGEDKYRLLIRWTDEAVYLATQARAGDAPRFELGIMPAVDASTTLSGRFFAGRGRGGPMESRYLLGSREQPWNCDWEGAVRAGGDEAFVEFRIPLETLADRARPYDGKRWRINARLTAAGEGGARRTVAEWGDSKLDSLEHGALLVFER